MEFSSETLKFHEIRHNHKASKLTIKNTSNHDIIYKVTNK